MPACLNSDFSFSVGAEMSVWGLCFVDIFWLVCYTVFPRTAYEEQFVLKLRDLSASQIGFFWFGLFLRSGLTAQTSLKLTV